MADQATKKATEDKKGFIKEALDTAGQIAQTGLHVEELKEKAARRIEDGLIDAKRLIKRSRYAAEDLVDDTAHYIKQDPFRSVGVSFAVGLGLGALIGLLVGRRKSSRL